MRDLFGRKIIILSTLLLLGGQALAFSGVTYHGRILKPNGSVIDGQFVGFRVRVMDGNTGSCQMYEEIRTKDMRNSAGTFSIVIGDGGVPGAYDVTGVALFDELFANNRTFNFNGGHPCVGTPYAADARHGRVLNVSFRESPADAWENLPSMILAHVPFSYSSLVSQKVGTHDSSSLLRVENGGVPSAAAALTPANFTELLALLNGSTSQYIKSVAGTAGQVTANTVAGAVTLSLPAVGTAGTYGSATQVPVLTTDAQGRITGVVNTTITGAAPTGAAGGDLTGNFPDPTIVNDAVTTAKILDANVTTGKLANLSVTDTKLAANSVITAKILDANVTLDKLAGDSVNSSKIVDNSITGSDISTTAALSIASVAATGNVGAGTMSTRSIGLFELPGNGTDSVTLQAPAALAGSTVYILPATDGANGDVLSTNSSGILSWVNLPASGTGDIINGGNTTGAEVVIGTNDAQKLSFETGNAKAMTIDATGNVGIGTTTPSALYKLDVSGAAINLTSAGNASLRLEAPTGVSYLDFVNGAGTTNTRIYGGSGGTSNISFATGGGTLTEKMRISNAGNVGIGTTNPTSKLSVIDGRIGVSGAGGYLQVGQDSADGNKSKISFHSTNFQTTDQYFTGIQYNNAAGWLSVGGGTNLNLNLDSGSGASFNSHVFRKIGWDGTNRTYTEVARIDGSGNLGVGTAAPGAKLDVKGDVAISGATSGAVKFTVPAVAGSATYTWPAAAPGSNMVLQSNAAGVLSWVADSSGPANAFVQSGNAFGATALLGTTDNNALRFITNNTEKMTILPGGNVGIGTTAPTAKLHLDSSGAGTVMLLTRADNNDGIRQSLNAADLGLTFIKSGTDSFRIKADHTNSFSLIHNTNSDKSVFNISRTAGVYTTYIDAGNVGIGTTTPTNGKLEVKGSIVMDGATSGYVGLQPATNAGSVIYTLPSADGGNGDVLKTDGSGVLAWVPQGTPGNASYAAKGVVQFDTDAATSGITVAAGVAKIATGGVATGMHADDSVTYAKMQNVTTNKLLGRATAGAGDTEEITLGTGLSFTGTTLNASGIAAVTNTANLANTKIWIGDAGGKAQEFALSGDATMTAGGLVTVDATNLNTVSKIMKRDASGNFLAGTGTFNTSVKVTDGAAGGQVTIAAPALFTSYNLTLPIDDGGVNQVLQTNGSGVLSWANQPTVTGMIVDGGNTTGAEIVIGTNDAQKLSFETGNAKAMTIDATGKVGIGTTTPSQKLDVNGKVNANNYYAGWGSAGDPSFAISGGQGLFAANSGADLAFANGSATRMTLTAAGNLGIGLTAPSNKLSVDGNVSVVNGSIGFNRNPTDGSLPSGGNAGASRFQLASSSAAFGLEAYDTAGAQTGALYINGASGRVGIGTGTPASQLEIANTTSGAQLLGLAGPSAAFWLGPNANTAMFPGNGQPYGIGMALSTSAGSYGGDIGDLNLMTYSSAVAQSNAMRFLTPSAPNSGATLAERMRITQAGNVGIGISAPASPLVVKGNSADGMLRIVPTTANTEASIGFYQQTDGTSTADRWIAGVSGWGHTNKFAIGYGAGPNLVITTAGNVGIGTASPGQKLEVNGTIKATDLILTSDRKFKRDIASLNPQLENILSVRPVSFNWKDSGKPDIGVIAQELRQVYPGLVVQNPDHSLSVKYTSLIAPLISAVQELYRKFLDQSLEIAELKEKNRSLEERMSRLEKSQTEQK